MKGFAANLHRCKLDLKTENICQCFILKLSLSILGRREFLHMGHQIRSMKINTSGCQVRMRGKMTLLQ